jgi:geranylgeranyl diphosphate synthase type II
LIVPLTLDSEVDASVFNIASYLDERKQWIDKTLSNCLDRMDPWPPLLREAVDYSLFAGGKRIRPVLALASLEAVGGKAETAIPLVCSLEFVHTYSLIHDDLPAMDNDDFRRGLPTNHKKFGEGVAILAGDALLTAAFSILTDPAWTDPYPPQSCLAACHELSIGAGGEGMVGGQLMDIVLEGRRIDSVTLRLIHSKKTGALIRSAVRLGAILGGTGDEELSSLTRYGEKVGLAFQIADDILDVEGTRQETGKSTQRDRENQKNTYPSLLGLERSKELSRTLVDEALEALRQFDQRGAPEGDRPVHYRKEKIVKTGSKFQVSSFR